MEPIPETVEALHELDPADADDLLPRLRQLAARAQELVPALMGVSVARFDHGLTFTLVATDDDVATLDAVQYAAGGPCVEAAHDMQVREFDNDDDVLSETSWQLFAGATAAQGVRSTLTLPLVDADGGALGTVNLYAASPNAFRGHHEELAQVFDAWAAGAVANADLSFTTRRVAQEAPGRVRDAAVIDTAVGMLAADLGVDIETAERRLAVAAQYAGVSVSQLARDIVRSHRDRGASDEDDG